MSQSLFTTQTPVNTDDNEGVAVLTSTMLTFARAGWVTAIRFRAPATISGTYTAGLYVSTTDDNPVGSGTGTLLDSMTCPTPTASSWNTVLFPNQPAVSPGNAYRITLHSSSGRFVHTATFSFPLSNGDITAPADGTDPVGLGTMIQSPFKDSATLAYPNDSALNQSCYFIDVVFEVPDTPKRRSLVTYPYRGALIRGRQILNRPAPVIPEATVSTIDGDITATADLAGAAALTATAAGAIIATGAATGAATLAQTAAGAITATGTITGAAAATEVAAGAITATATITGAAKMTGVAAGAILATAAMAAEAALVATAGGQLAATATIAGDATVTSAPVNAYQSIDGTGQTSGSIDGATNAGQPLDGATTTTGVMT